MSVFVQLVSQYVWFTCQQAAQDQSALEQTTSLPEPLVQRKFECHLWKRWGRHNLCKLFDLQSACDLTTLETRAEAMRPAPNLSLKDCKHLFISNGLDKLSAGAGRQTCLFQ